VDRGGRHVAAEDALGTGAVRRADDDRLRAIALGDRMPGVRREGVGADDRPRGDTRARQLLPELGEQILVQPRLHQVRLVETHAAIERIDVDRHDLPAADVA
jgi:hypothetical protein